MQTDTHFLSYLAQLFLELEMFQLKCIEEIKPRVLFSVTFFSPKIVPFFRCNVEKYFRPWQTTYKNTAHAYCMLDT